MTKFTFITNLKGKNPERRVAEIMRRAAHVIERQVPPQHYHMYDTDGTQLCEWDIEEVEPEVGDPTHRLELPARRVTTRSP
jgi:hypothetical protein